MALLPRTPRRLRFVIAALLTGDVRPVTHNSRAHVLAVVLLLGSASSDVLGYTEAPGQRKGIFFCDDWGRTWFLRPGPTKVSGSVAEKAQRYLGQPVIFDVSSFDRRSHPREYRDGELAPDSASQAVSSGLALSVCPAPQAAWDTDVPMVIVVLRFSGAREFIRLRDLCPVVFSADADGVSLSRRPDAISVGILPRLDCGDTVFSRYQPDWEPERIVRTGEELALRIPLLRYRRLSQWWNGLRRGKPSVSDPELRFPPGDYELLAVCFVGHKEFRVISEPARYTVVPPPTAPGRGLLGIAGAALCGGTLLVVAAFCVKFMRAQH